VNKNRKDLEVQVLDFFQLFGEELIARIEDGKMIIERRKGEA